jgi:hypothetical protein
MKQAFQREPEAYQQVQAALPQESVLAVQTMFTAAESLRTQAAQQAAQQ